jgi:Flp pilus assembly protein TadD
MSENLQAYMSCRRLLLIVIIGAMAGWPYHGARAGDLRLSLPQRSKPTPVQRLNREGVEAVRKHRYDQAKGLFYRAFLFDPEDPFTLNNLGYISELEGDAENAQRFYRLAAQYPSKAVIDKASSPQIEGKLVQDVLAGNQDLRQTNRANREAVRLLSKGRATEANSVLERSLSTDPHNAFTLNNIGVAKEMQGELAEAARYYLEAVNASDSAEPVTIASVRAWRGRPINEMASANARSVQDQLQAATSEQAKAAQLSFRGVLALNRNDRDDARQYFQQAYALDQSYSFSLNNIGYLAELDGDLETAEDFYRQARAADRSKMRIGLATRRSAEGMKLSDVAAENNQQAEARITEKHNSRLQEKRPVELRHRNRKHAEPDQHPPSPNPSNPD